MYVLHGSSWATKSLSFFQMAQPSVYAIAHKFPPLEYTSLDKPSTLEFQSTKRLYKFLTWSKFKTRGCNQVTTNVCCNWLMWPLIKPKEKHLMMENSTSSKEMPWPS